MFGPRKGPLHFRILIARASFGLEFSCTLALFLISLIVSVLFFLFFRFFFVFSIFCNFIFVMMLANLADKQ